MNLPTGGLQTLTSFFQGARFVAKLFNVCHLKLVLHLNLCQDSGISINKCTYSAIFRQ